MQQPISKQWADFRRTLESELGVEGSAHWLAFAAKQQATRARKFAERNVLELPDQDWRP